THGDGTYEVGLGDTQGAALGGTGDEVGNALRGSHGMGGAESVTGSGAMERGAFVKEGRGNGRPQGMGEPIGDAMDATGGAQIDSQGVGDALSFLGSGPTRSSGGFDCLGTSYAGEIGRDEGVGETRGPVPMDGARGFGDSLSSIV
ncbi:unnamed protein product, partial [Ilex paraguariensis]